MAFRRQKFEFGNLKNKIGAFIRQFNSKKIKWQSVWDWQYVGYNKIEVALKDQREISMTLC